MGIASSGQITVTTAGTAVRGPDLAGSRWALTGHPANTDVVYVGDDGNGDVAATTGYPLSNGTATAMDHLVVFIGNLRHLWFDAAVSGEKICWIRVD